LRVAAFLVVALCTVAAAQQLPAPPPVPVWVAVKPIDPPATPLPPEAASARVTKFSFVAYGDTRSGSGPGGDLDVVHPEHTRVMDRVLATAKTLAATPFPIRFVLQSGDAVLRGQSGTMWNVGFTPIIERLTRGANIPYFFTAGNHDVTTAPAGDPARAMGLHNTLTAISKLIPPEGSPRRLNGYPTYAFGYGNAFFIALDSNIASDTIQLSWVTDQLEHLDRTRYRHVIVFFHHPAFSSGPHGGASADPVPGTGRKAPDRIEAQTASIRTLYLPLFRKHHVRMLITGHDHLYDHFVERYDSGGVTYRMETIVTGGGGAPLYGYIGEPDLRGYVAASPGDNLRVEHLMKPGPTAAENPHHFVVIQVDGDRLSLQVIGTGETEYLPYPGGLSKVSLEDK
jgi:calcineurin-like phosphoesterase family protein